MESSHGGFGEIRVSPPQPPDSTQRNIQVGNRNTMVDEHRYCGGQHHGSPCEREQAAAHGTAALSTQKLTVKVQVPSLVGSYLPQQRSHLSARQSRCQQLVVAQSDNLRGEQHSHLEAEADQSPDPDEPGGSPVLFLELAAEHAHTHCQQLGMPVFLRNEVRHGPSEVRVDPG